MLSKGDSITIEHLGKEYIIDIIDTKPDDVVVIVETDVEVDIEYAEVLDFCVDPVTIQRENNTCNARGARSGGNFASHHYAWRIRISQSFRFAIIRHE